MSHKIQLRQTVKLLTKIAEEQPAAGQIAIEYLKQAESQENQALLEQMLQELCLLETSSSDGIQKLHVREDKL